MSVESDWFVNEVVMKDGMPVFYMGTTFMQVYMINRIYDDGELTDIEFVNQGS